MELLIINTRVKLLDNSSIAGISGNRLNRWVNVRIVKDTLTNKILIRIDKKISYHQPSVKLANIKCFDVVNKEALTEIFEGQPLSFSVRGLSNTPPKWKIIENVTKEELDLIAYLEKYKIKTEGIINSIRRGYTQKDIKKARKQLTVVVGTKKQLGSKADAINLILSRRK